ncbi:MAG: glycine cleavage system aminomethyltransferase GcvT [Gemmatimonadota bacterium]|nr:MAG: glycine cleavage system aminomethyltransferase GcvT [Gemmatimonadota bacterium]
MASDLKRTPLYEEHLKLGGKIIPFAGFEMPVQYPAGVSAEHQAVREHAGLFDVSHMGEFLLEGERAAEFVDYLVANDISRRESWQATYCVMCNEQGGVVDDLLVYKFPDRFRLVVNAANMEKDFDWVSRCLERFGPDGVELVNESDAIALLALQGPDSEAILTPLSELDPSTLGYYRFAESRVAGEPCVVSRTGYTGEDGFELYCGPDSAAKLWNALLEAGGERIHPVGLGARDTLRLEAGLALYGSDIDDETTPLEAGLGWTVKLDKGEFVGRDALLAQKEKGLKRKLCGFVLESRGFPRPGYEIRCGGEAVGTVRSGTFGPTLGQGIGTGYLLPELAKPGTELEIVIRQVPNAGEVVKMPFYKEGSVKR